MSKLLVLLILTANSVCATPSLNDVSYKFDKEKLESADDAFSFFRSFADYYYELLNSNRQLSSLQKLADVSGWCAGDAHAENFGALLQRNGSSVFAINDMDDAGPCPVVMDLQRFYIAALFVLPEVDLYRITGMYVNGLLGEIRLAPQIVNKMLTKSVHRGPIVDPDDVQDGKLIRKKKGRELTPTEHAQIVTVIGGEFELLDAYAFAKEGGGSDGIQRYNLLVRHASEILNLELKGQVAPAVTTVAPVAVPATKERIATTLKMEQGDLVSPFYRVVQLAGQDYLLRPRFHGNVDAKIKGSTASELAELIQYEAYQLGRLHAQTVGKGWAGRLVASQGELVADVRALEEFFIKKFQALKAN